VGRRIRRSVPRYPQATDWGCAFISLLRAGVVPGPASRPEWSLPTGHYAALQAPDPRRGTRDWALLISHPGEPAGHRLRLSLGPDAARTGQRAVTALARPRARRELDRQTRRASDAAAVKKLQDLCWEVRNSPLALLCGDALAGDPDARRRVTAILAGRPDPGAGRPGPGSSRYRELYPFLLPA
jgi:hypothetical protein